MIEEGYIQDTCPLQIIGAGKFFLAIVSIQSTEERMRDQ